MAKDFTILIFPKISVALEFASANLSWYYFFSLFKTLTISKTMTAIIGVAITMQRVKDQLITHRNTILPTNCIMLLKNIDMLSLAAFCTTPMSLVSLDTNSPDL